MPQSVCLSGVCPPKFMRLPKFLGCLRRFIETLINKPMRSAEKLINRVLGKTLSITLLWWIPFFIIRYQLPISVVVLLINLLINFGVQARILHSSILIIINFRCAKILCAANFSKTFLHTHTNTFIYNQTKFPNHLTISLLFMALFGNWEVKNFVRQLLFFNVFTPLKWIYFRNVFIRNQTLPLSVTSFSGWFAQKSPVLFNKNFLLVNNNILM